MPPASEPPAGAVAPAVAACRADAEALSALRALYDRADAETADRALCCLGCGACCRFETAGHRLLASTAELALLTERPPTAPLGGAGRCPYQHGARCTARPRRPLGCRLYFCDEPPAGAAERYERYHRAVRRLHAAHGLPYVYAELTAALADLLAPGPARAADQNADFPVDTRRPRT